MMKLSETLAHVAVLAFPLTCHPIALFNLVKKLATSAPNIQFSFLNTENSNNSILSQNLPLLNNIRTFNVDDGSVDEGPNYPHQKFFRFLNAVPENFRHCIDEAEKEIGRKITCFISDAFFSSAVCKLSQEMNVPWILYWILAPFALPAYLNIDLIQKQINSHISQGLHQAGDLVLDIIPGLSPTSYLDLPLREVTEPVDDLRDSRKALRSLYLSMVETMSQASAIVMNSYEELNPSILVNHLKSEFKNLLFLSSLTLSGVDEDDSGCLSWLDRQKPESVAYICFGTAERMPQEELSGLAEALESRETPFLWCIKEELKVHLPNGFLDRMNLKGKFISWAPQIQVLKHASIGVYVTHCGYNSVIESILGGVPMICRSLWGDNYVNAKMVEEVWEIGVRVEGRKITKEGMIKSLEIIFQVEKGKKIKENIKNLKQCLLKAAGPDGVAAQDLKTLVHIISKE